MTRERKEFEEWYDANHKEPIHPADRRTDGDYRLGISGKWHVWQASREQLKAKLLSDEMVEKVAELIQKESIEQDEILGEHNSGRAWRDLIEEWKQSYRNIAKAALQAVVGEL
jgi:hypothetical protein